MYKLSKRCVSIVELLIALSLFGLLIISVSGLETFSRFHLITLDRRAQIQDEGLNILKHMKKHLLGQASSSKGGAIGNISQPPIELTPISGDTAVTAYIDTDVDGIRDDTTTDKQAAYRFSGSNYEIWYYDNYTDSPASYDVIGNKVTLFTPTYSSNNNYLEIQISVCWDPSQASASCGDIENPKTDMRTRIVVPAASAS